MAESTDNTNNDRPSQTESRLSLVGRETRWKNGVSGNPAGRPKRSGDRPLHQILIEDGQWPEGINGILARKLASRP
jgi:hypothetical protein